MTRGDPRRKAKCQTLQPKEGCTTLKSLRHKQRNGVSHMAGVINRVWALVSGSDPDVAVVRESDLDTIEVEQDSHDEWFADGEHIYSNGAEDARNLAFGHLRMAVRRLAVARAIERQEATR